MRYKTYLYLDELGRLTVEPELILLDGSNTKIKLSEHDQKIIKNFGCFPVYKLLHLLNTACQGYKKQKLAEDQALDEQMQLLGHCSQPEALAHYTSLIEQRISLLTDVIRFSFTEQVSTLNFLKNLLDLAHKGKLFSQPQVEKPKPAEVVQAAPAEQSTQKKKTRRKKGKSKTIQAQMLKFQEDGSMSADQFATLIAGINTKMTNLQHSKAPDEIKNLYIELGQAFFLEGSVFYHLLPEDELKAEFELLRLEFVREMNQRIDSLDDEALVEFASALIDGYCLSGVTTPERLLVAAIKADRGDILEKMIQSRAVPVSEHDFYQFDEKQFTLLEASVYYFKNNPEAMSCYECLLRRAFTFAVISGVDSPLLSTKENGMQHSLELAAVSGRALSRGSNSFVILEQAHEVCERYANFFDGDEEKGAIFAARAAYFSAALSYLKKAKYKHNTTENLYVDTNRMGELVRKFGLERLTECSDSMEGLKVITQLLSVRTQLLDYMSPSAIKRLISASLPSTDDILPLLQTDEQGLEQLNLNEEELAQFLAANIENMKLSHEYFQVILDQFKFGNVKGVSNGRLLFNSPTVLNQWNLQSQEHGRKVNEVSHRIMLILARVLPEGSQLKQQTEAYQMHCRVDELLNTLNESVQDLESAVSNTPDFAAMQQFFAPLLDQNNSEEESAPAEAEVTDNGHGC